MKRLACVFAIGLAGCAAPTADAPASDEGPHDAAAASGRTTPEQAPGATEALEHVLATDDNVPNGITVDDVALGDSALSQPLPESSTLPSLPGFIDARLVRLGTSGPGSYWDEGGYVTWGAAYESAAAATAAFEVLTADFHGEDGWEMERVGDPSLGDDSLTVEGAAYGFDTNRLHIWRARNLLLAVGALGDTTASTDEGFERLTEISEEVNNRASALP